MPQAVLRPRQTRFHSDLNNDLANFGEMFRATARRVQNLKDDPKLKGLLERLPGDDHIDEFSECPFCQRKSSDFSKKFAFYRHIRGGSCSNDDFVKFAGI